jgi:hypothetical protein
MHGYYKTVLHLPNHNSLSKITIPLATMKQKSSNE